MFGDLGNFITLLIGAIAIAGAAGTGWQRGRIAQLRERVTDLEGVREENKELRRDIDAVVRRVTGEERWTAIQQQLTDHDKAARAHWREQLDLLRAIAGRPAPAIPAPDQEGRT